ncbi:MAG TPA: BPTI/Kunitz domain-containing protein [Polyangiaceae bacterium]|nr:BPTI/Kunitz domain-containing protein [Polyangiaceae bacterium]
MAAGVKRGFLYGVAVVWLLACGGVVGKPTVGGESHFLRRCGDGCGSGLKCISDICTRDCIVDQDSCGDLSHTALCTNVSVEPGVVAVCDVACASSRDCTALGAGFACSDGFCRDVPPTIPDPTGSAGAGASGGSTSQPSGGQTGSGAVANGGKTGSGAAANGGAASGGTAGQPPKPPQKCAMPFDGGECLAYQPVFAAVNGQCVPEVYGGCGGNDNRFYTLEECMSVCELRPSTQACPTDRPAQSICLECGPAGGCAKQGSFCAQACDDTHPCDSMTLQCFAGICQAYGCE